MRHPLILQLNHGGVPVRWINYDAAATYYVKDQVLWELGEEDITLHGGMNRITGIQSRLVVRPIIAIKQQYVGAGTGRMRSVPRLTNRNLFSRDRHMCAYCGHDFGGHILTRDHVIPVSVGGKDQWTNVVTACKSCNNRKADRTPEQANMPLLYVPYTPNFAEALILSNRNILACQMDFLKNMVGADSRLMVC